MSSQSSLKNVIDNAFIALSGSMGANILGLLSIAVFTQSMGPEKYGYYVLFLTFVEIIERIFNFQTWQAFIKFSPALQLNNDKHHFMMLLKYCFAIDFISLVVAFFVAFLFIEFFVNFFEIPAEYASLVMVMASSFFFKVFDVSIAVFRIFDAFQMQAKILICSALVKFLVFSIVAVTAPTLPNFIYATLFSQFLGVLMRLFYTKQILNKKGFSVKEVILVSINYQFMKTLGVLSFVVYNNFDIAVRMVSRQLDSVLLGKLYGPEAVGVFRIVKELAGIIAKLTDSIYQAVYPELSKLLSSKKEKEAKEVALKVAFYTGISGIFSYILFIIFGEFVINHAFGEKFIAAYDVALIYFIAIIIAVATLPLYPMQHAFGFAKDAFNNQLQSTLIYIPSAIFLITCYGMHGASISHIIYYTILTKLTLGSVKKGFA